MEFVNNLWNLERKGDRVVTMHVIMHIFEPSFFAFTVSQTPAFIILFYFLLHFSFQHFKRTQTRFHSEANYGLYYGLLARPPPLCLPPHSPPVPGFSSSSVSLLPRSPCSLPPEDKEPSEGAWPVRTLA